MNASRWEQRAKSFDRAYLLLAEAVDADEDSLSELEKEGVIQRFEYTFELAWKTLNDYLLHQGLQPEPVTPRAVIKQPFSAGIIEEGQGWIDMLEHRTFMSHAYDRGRFLEAFQAIRTRYCGYLGQLSQWFKKHRET